LHRERIESVERIALSLAVKIKSVHRMVRTARAGNNGGKILEDIREEMARRGYALLVKHLFIR